MSRFSYSVSHNLSFPCDVAVHQCSVILRRRLGLRDACAAKGRMGGPHPQSIIPSELPSSAHSLPNLRAFAERTLCKGAL